MSDKCRRDEARSSTAGTGGDIRFFAGRGGVDPQGRRASDGSVVFYLGDGTEVLRFGADGDVFVRGEKVDANPQAYAAMQAWLGAAVWRLGQGLNGGMPASFTPHAAQEAT